MTPMLALVLAMLVADTAPRPSPTPPATPSRPPAKTRPPVARPSVPPAAKPSPARATPLPLPPRRPRPPAPAGLSWEDADALELLVAGIEERLRAGQPAADGAVFVSQRQLNSYVNLSLAPSIPKGISDLELELQPERLAVRAMIDLDALRQRLPSGSVGGVLSLLSGTVPVELQGRLASGNGIGQAQIELATIAGVGVPASMLAQMVAVSTRSRTQPQGVDIQAPFRLPWTARQIRLERGRAQVDFFGKR